LTINALSAITTLTLLSATAHPESGAAIPGRSAALNVQSDDSDSHDVAGTLVLPFGQHAWTQLMAGSTHARIDNESTDTRMAGASVGLQTGAFQSRLAFAYRKDNDSLRLQDWNGAVTYFAKQGSLGIDLFYRTSEDETVISRGGRLRNPKAIAIANDEAPHRASPSLYVSELRADGIF